MFSSNLKKILIISSFNIKIDNLPINLNILILKCKEELCSLPENLKKLELIGKKYTLDELINLPRNLEKIIIGNLHYNSTNELIANYPNR